MAKVEGMRGKDISKPTFIKRGAVDTTGTFPNNNNNNYNNKRPTTGKDYGMEKKIKVEETKTVEYCNFCNKPRYRAEECWKKAGACLRCGNRDHRLPNCPMLKDQAGRNQGVGRVEELLVAEELWNDHKKPFFFPFSSAATCTNHPLEVDQRAFTPSLISILQKRSSPDSMAASVIAGSLGGYGAEFLTPEQQERFTFVKTKVCGNKAVDMADLEKNGMHSIAAALSKMQWLGITTFSEVSYPDLLKAFFVCLKAEADGSLVSSVKGTLIKIDYDLLHRLFGVKTSGQSGVHTVDAQAKGLGIVGPEFRLRDGKLDINQFNAFNRLLHFIVFQILVPRSATFSTCTKADSDVMLWAIQNKEINMAEVMFERMKFARDQIWDTRSKLNVSLPYAHLLTKIFKHFGVDLSGAVVENIGQAIRSRNLRKSGFSLVNGIWSKTSVAEGEAIIEDVPEVQEDVPAASTEPAGAASVENDEPSELAAASKLAATVQEESQPSVAQAEEPVEGVVFVDAPIQGEQYRIMEDAPIQGEQETEDLSASQGVHSTDAPVHEEQTTAHQDTAERKGKKIAHRRRRTSQTLKLKPILKRLEAQNALLFSVQSDVVRSPPYGTQNVSEAVLRPSGPVIAEEDSVPVQVQTQQQVEEPRPSDENAGPSGQNLEEVSHVAISMADGVPSEDQGPVVQAEGLSSLEISAAVGEAQAVVPEPSTLPTPAPPSPPTSSTARPAPPVPKKPRSRQISSPTPITSSTTPLPSSTVEVLPGSSLAGAFSSGPSSSRPNDPSTITPDSLIHPPVPPSFITLIPEGAQLTQPEIHGIKDEFEETIHKSVLATGTHSHRTGISSPVDFATLKFPDIVFLPPLHSSIMDSSVGTLVFERAARVMARLHVYEGRDLSFQRFVFKHYLEGQISADILAPILSECERLTSDEWLKHYPLSAQQLSDLNASQAQANLPPRTPGDFLDANSRHLIRNTFTIWLERFKIFRDLMKEVRSHQIFYPIKMDKFLLFAGFGSFSIFKIALGLDKYGDFISEQWKLHLKQMAPTMGPSYKIEIGAFQAHFEEQERLALPVIRQFASLLKTWCGIQGVVPFGCEGRPGVVSRVLFPLGVKEDQLSWVL
ncbi:hypothetical protein Taro_002365 [Colocasia esculenta]|uniref:CCHC-type domain-containing protein n=1 Tax=Colocasia esculenta TaxID=4460 RepID=A0A843TLD9_COLES|nr:hypothetical protein [Colocasia esculenta]